MLKACIEAFSSAIMGCWRLSLARKHETHEKKGVPCKNLDPEIESIKRIEQMLDVSAAPTVFFRSVLCHLYMF